MHRMQNGVGQKLHVSMERRLCSGALRDSSERRIKNQRIKLNEIWDASFVSERGRDYLNNFEFDPFN
jgi:hypothetical protein